jgi:ABC-2 type transport system permease protein
MRALYWVWRRELHVMLRAPILYVVGGLFLVVQGVAFAGLVGALSDPRKPAPLGALLEGQLAGTLLTWVLALVVLTLLGMRAIADDKRTGAWELLLTAQVSEAAAVIGKWLAAATLYALLWIPTLAYLVVVAVYRADSGGWDGAAIVCGYLGAIAIGWALLAWAIAASAAMSSMLGAGALGFALLLGIFLVGELPAIWPDLPRAAHVFEAISVRQRAIELARGELSLSAIVFVVGLAVTGLSLAITLACAGRRRAREVRRRGVTTIAIATIAVCLGILTVRHPVRIDASAAHRNTLDAVTRDVLAALPQRATITIVRPTYGGLEGVYDELARVVERMGEYADLDVRWVDPASAPGGLDAVARAAGVSSERLAGSGAVIVEIGQRRRVLDVFAIAQVDVGPGGATTVQRLAIEQAVAGTLAELSLARPITVCFTTGHGELPITQEWKLVADRLKTEGFDTTEVGVAREVPKQCSVLVIAGPSSRFTAEEALGVQAYIRGDGPVVFAAASRTLAPGADDPSGATGLEPVLANEGIQLPPAFAVDPALTILEMAGTLLVIDGYTDNPINAGFAKARATLWFQPRAIVLEHGATPLVRASNDSWGEVDLQTKPPAHDDRDIAGPIVLAALGRSGRVLVLSSAESLLPTFLNSGASALDLWLTRAIRHLARLAPPAIAARTPDQVRLLLTPGQRSMVIALSVAGIPLAWLLAGGAVLFVRRKKRSAA